jgi:hypothetical protein
VLPPLAGSLPVAGAGDTGVRAALAGCPPTGGAPPAAALPPSGSLPVAGAAGAGTRATRAGCPPAGAAARPPLAASLPPAGAPGVDEAARPAA